MNVPQIIARLAGEPFHLPPAATLRLTPYQIALLFTAPDEIPLPAPAEPVPNDAERWEIYGRQNKLPRYLVERRRAHCR